MKYLISEYFKRRLDSMSDRRSADAIVAKLADFGRALAKEEGRFRDLPSGFWVRKIKDSPNIYKFRINSGDRILFSPLSECGDNRHEYQGSIIFIDICTHDQQVRKGKRSSGKITPVDLEIDFEPYSEDFDVEDRLFSGFQFDGSEKPISYDLNKSVTYVLEEKQFSALLEEKNQDWIFYLNDKQYECLRHIHTPLLLRGSAGSGKTTVALHKLLTCSHGNYDVAYFTYTKHLLDNAERLYSRFKGEGDRTSFNRISDYCLRIVGRKEFDLMTIEGFLGWYQETQLRFKFFTTFDPVDVWAEIRGVIKGFMGLAWGRDGSHPLLRKEEYLGLSDKYSVFSKQDRERLFNIATKYQEWLDQEGRLDENDCARLAIVKQEQSGSENFDYIVVDEVQDLTELQIAFLLRHVRDLRNIFFSGDEHQNVNATYFAFHRIGVFFAERGKIRPELITLNQNYRSQRNIVDLANRLIDLRKKHIGATECDYHESFVRDGRKPFFVSNKSDFLQSIVAKANERHYCIIVTPDSEEKRRLLDVLGANARVFTVSEVKGLEYPYVICCNLISRSRRHWDDILANRGRKDARYRYYFNAFYVAITRARENLCIYEDEEGLPLFEQLGSMFDIVDEFDEERMRLTQLSSSSEWLRDAMRLEAQGKLFQAIGAYKKAEDAMGEARCRAMLLAREGRYAEAGDLAMAAGLFQEAAEYFQQGNDVFNSLKCRIWSGDTHHELEDLGLNLSRQVELFVKNHPHGEDFQPFVRYLDDVMREKIFDKGVYIAEWMALHREGN